MQPAARLENVAVWRWEAATGTRTPILADISWQIGPGERWALLGPNGAGKTSLLTVLGAIDFPSRGAVEILGRMLGRADVRRLREGIGHVDARTVPRYAPRLTVEDVVRTGATGTIGYFLDRLTLGDLARVDELVATFGLGPLAGRPFASCSHGEQQRALIARALVPRPRLLLLDEPGAGLDLPGREILLAALDRMTGQEPDLAVVTTTHHVEELPASTSHALLLRGGSVVAQGPVAEVLTPQHMSVCFGLPVVIERAEGRWRAVARERPVDEIPDRFGAENP